MTVLTEHPAFKVGYAEMSETMRRFDAESQMLRLDPVRALLLRIEAISGHRAENHQCEASKLAIVRELARLAIKAHTGEEFRSNPIFP